VNKHKDVLCPRMTILLPKREYISCPLFLEDLISFFFFKILTSLKRNKRILCYKGGMSVSDKKTSSKRMKHIDASARRHVQEKYIRENYSMVHHKGKKLYKDCI
jgi:hypothetical protein